MNEISGWLLDLYAGQTDLSLWIIGDDGARHHLHHVFPTTFYVAGPFPHLRQVWQFVRQQPIIADLARVTRRDLFSGSLNLLAIQVPNPAQQPKLLYQIIKRFPELDYYDTDIPLSVRYAATYNLFPLARCRIWVDDENQVRDIEALDDPWDIETKVAPLKIVTIEPDSDPQHKSPVMVTIRGKGGDVHIPLRPFRHLLLSIKANLKRRDPDLLLTRWGDTWLFPLLEEGCKQEGIGFFNPNRDPSRQPLHYRENSYFTYGQVVYRGRQTHLFGRWHIDQRNAMMYSEYGLLGVLEQARVTGMSVQEMARKSPGAGVTALQMQTALRQGVLVPHNKQQVESFKTAHELIRADRGGLVYQPTVGLHYNVAEIDFISLYPGLMVHFNISPETVGMGGENSNLIPEINVPVDQSREGLIPASLRPLLAKRIAIKEQLAGLDKRDVRYRPLKARVAGLKWLLVVCFGYLGYKNARFGRIEGHEAVTAHSRDVLLSSKETAEDLGYQLLHMYVDGLWVKGDKGQITREAARKLTTAIAQRTSMPIALEGIYRWIAFLPSRLDERVPVPNRYFGILEDGSLKVRGIELRRHDTAPFIAAAQRRSLELLAGLSPEIPPQEGLPALISLWRDVVARLREEKIPLEDLRVYLRVSRKLEAYRNPSPAARALTQLARAGKERRPGQRIALLFTRGEPGVHAWDLPEPPDPASIDVAHYEELLLRAADTLLRPLGLSESISRSQILSNAYQPELPLFTA